MQLSILVLAALQQHFGIAALRAVALVEVRRVAYMLWLGTLAARWAAVVHRTPKIWSPRM